MNLRRGFLRCWVVLSVFYCIGIGALFFGDLRDEFTRPTAADWSKYGVLMLPVSCTEARGKEETDYSSKKAQACANTTPSSPATA